MAFPFVDPCTGTYGAGPLITDYMPVQLWRYGLLSVATVIDETDDHARNGIAYKSWACAASLAPWVDDCDSPPTKTPTDTDVADGSGTEDNIQRGCPFHLYAALSCKTTNLEDMKGNVAEVYRVGEQAAVEGQVWTNVLATSASTVLNASSNAADAFTVVGGIAALESAMAACYGGLATIHADRGLAAYLKRDHQLCYMDDVVGQEHYETALGTKIAFYGGADNTSPAGVAAPDGYAWIYITPELTLRRFPIDILPEDAAHRLQYINGAGDMTNVPYVLAERTYVPSTECCRFAALVCLAC